ncbi:MAG: aldehyde ferredoxin oxidoreductase N-terminal domain-containing protein [Natronincolaceae bacterium]|jgi:aldehyde:ferredoxin oxidoreductase
MGRIFYIDLTEEKITEKQNTAMDYGRGLAARIMEEEVPPNTDRLDKDNAIVLIPGLLSGTVAPSTGRLIAATKRSGTEGIQYSNLAGTISQKLASLNIEALVITGKNVGDTPLIIIIEKDGVILDRIEGIKGLEVSPTINKIKKMHGKECGIIGIGPAGENLLPVSTLFSTYPEGEPAFYCARSSIGDVFGYKGLKAIGVKTDEHFNAYLQDEKNMKETAKTLSRMIIDHPICGRALPGLGSITLMKMLKEGSDIDLSSVGDKKVKKSDKPLEIKINRTCSPLCVIGCLNRHAKSGEDYYSSPAESEAQAALKDAFGIGDKQYVKDFTKRCFEQGIDCIEFIFSCSFYFSLQGEKAGMEEMDKALEEVKAMTLLGRILGSKTTGIYPLFRDKEEYRDMVTRPSVREEGDFNVDIKSKTIKHWDSSDLDYLYAYIIALENLGFCLFSSFAFIENEKALSLLSNMYTYKTGKESGSEDILKYASETLKKENEYERKAKTTGVEKNIPEFVKVLYRYFHKNE